VSLRGPLHRAQRGQGPWQSRWWDSEGSGGRRAGKAVRCQATMPTFTRSNQPSSRLAVQPSSRRAAGEIATGPSRRAAPGRGPRNDSPFATTWPTFTNLKSDIPVTTTTATLTAARD
jgi:hypothetical protein